MLKLLKIILIFLVYVENIPPGQYFMGLEKPLPQSD